MFGFLFRGHKLSDRLEDRSDVLVMPPNSIFKLLQFGKQVLLAGEHPSQLDERSHDSKIDLDSTGTVKDAESIATPCSVNA